MSQQTDVKYELECELLVHAGSIQVSGRNNVTKVLRDTIAYLRNPANFGFDLSMEAEERRIVMLGRLNQALATNLSLGE